MDFRTILAIVIIGIIILLTPLYQKWLYRKAPPELEEKSPPAETTSTDTGAVGFRPPPVVKQEEVGRGIVVETPLYIAELNTKGAMLQSWRLKKFLDARGSPLELLRGRSGPGLVLEGVNLDSIEFSYDGMDTVEVSEGEREIVMKVACGDITVAKHFVFRSDGYTLGFKVMVYGAQGLLRGKLSWTRGIAVTEPDIKEDLNYTKVYVFMGGELENYDVGKGKSLNKSMEGMLSWIGVRNKYFLVAFVPSGEQIMEVGVEGDWSRSDERLYNFRLKEAGSSPLFEGKWYLGPLQYERVKALGVGLERVMNLGWWWIRPIGKLILKTLIWLHKLIPNYGLVIVLFSILVKVVVYPLTYKSYVASAKMQALQPKIAALRQKYKNDPQRLNREVMRLYKEHGVNPMGGCLPVLLQMPILIALFTVFRNTIEFRRAGFVLWLKDLSAPDPYYVLPVLMGITTFFQQRLSVKDPKQSSMIYIMPAVMVFLFAKFPSGLVLYYTMFNILSIAQQIYMMRRGKISV